MCEWKSYTELTQEVIAFLKEQDNLQPPKRSAIQAQIDNMIRSVYEMRPYVEREKRKTEVGET